MSLQRAVLKAGLWGGMSLGALVLLGLLLWGNPFPVFAATTNVPALECTDFTAPTSAQCMLLSQGVKVPPFLQGRQNPEFDPNQPFSFKRKLAQQITQSADANPFDLLNLLTLFLITLGPVKVIAPFVQLTQKIEDPSLRRQLAFRSAGISTVAILLFVVIGENLLSNWSIRPSTLMTAGGILLFLVALKVLLKEYEPGSQHEPSPEPSLDLAVSPLAFPTILPPFGIAIALVLSVVAPLADITQVQFLGALLLVMALNLVCMLLANQILNLIKPITLRILGFILGVLQLALGIELIYVSLELQSIILKQLLSA